MSENLKIDTNLDLVFEKISTLSVEQIWKAWTHPETLMKWFCPLPWRVTDCRMELISGGEFFTFMKGPNGEEMPNHGCILEVIENKKLVWTNMMTKGFRPSAVASPGFSFVATVLLSSTNKGTVYKAIVRHADEAGRKQHEQMGFQEGWGLAFSQLEELMKHK